MKTFVALAAFAGVVTGVASGAVISAYDFNTPTFAVGALGTDVTGVTAGQNGWFTFGGANSNYSIVNDPQSGGTRGQSLRISGPSSTSTATRYAWTDDVANNWGASDSHITSVFDLYVGSSSSTNQGGQLIFDSTGTKILAGVYQQASTGQLYLLANYNNAGTIGNYIFNLGTSAIMTSNAWHTLVVDYDVVTGRAQAGFLNTSTNSFSLFYVDGAAAGNNPGEADFIVSRNAASTGANFYFDNLQIQTTPTPGSLALLGLGGLVAGRRRR